MNPLYLPDTNILVHLVRRDATGLRIHALYQPLLIEPRPVLCIVSAGELRSLAYQLQWGQQKTEQARFLLNYFELVSIDDPDILEAYATMDAYSERVGRSMGKNDLWIAATAKVTGATLLTTDKDFDHLADTFIQRIWIDPDAEEAG